MLELCGNKGIKQEYSNARTPQQNRVAERMNRTLIEAARTNLMTRIDSLEKDLKQTKQTMGNAIVKLVKKVKKMEKVVKSRRVVLTDLEDEGAENSSKQGRSLQKDESEVFETPKQGKSSGETDISPQGLEAAEVLNVSKVSKREGKAVLKETPQTKRTKRQIKEEQASLAEIARIQAEDKAENARREELKRHDELAAKRLQKELKLNGVLDKLEKENLIAGCSREKAKLKRYTIISAHKDVLGHLIEESGVKESRKRTGEEIQTEPSKKLKSDTREDVSVPKEKDKEKGLQKKHESGTEEDVEAYMEERMDEPSSEEFPMTSIPQGPALAKIVKWQIIKTGKRGAYQIIREDNTDVVYVNFQGLLNDLTIDDLKELYRLMMLKYEDNRPGEEFERVLWGGSKDYV
ncbi:putative ribonuclease H-like domain-containing protein [Tanacetum coccineum]